MPVGEICKQLQPGSESAQDLVKILKDLLQKVNPVQVWPGSQGNRREADLDSAQIQLGH